MQEQINAVKRAIEELEKDFKNSGETYRDPVYVAGWVERFGPAGLERRCKIYEENADDYREQIKQLWLVIASLGVCQLVLEGGE
jgi:hypothetical protein